MAGIRRVMSASGVLAAAFCVSCNGPPRGSNGPPGADAPTFEQLAAAHNSRVARLREVYADGVIEIRWQDDKGKHFEQGNMELWLALPRKTSLRVEKLGEELLWLGSDETRYWLFDMTSPDGSVLYLGNHADQSENDDGRALSVRPLVLLDLMSMSPIPTDQSDRAIRVSESPPAWMIETTGSGGRLRLFFDRRTQWPIRVESLAADGTTSLSSTLGRYDSVQLSNTAQVDFPKMPTLIDIAGSASDGTAGEVKIAINYASGLNESDGGGAMFKLESLKASLKPARVEQSPP